jgi:hypothetical protein
MKWLDVSEIINTPSAFELRELSIGNQLNVNDATLIQEIEASFYKDLSVNDINSLRRITYQGSPQKINSVSHLFEAVLRYCEVNFWQIEKCMRKKWGRVLAPTFTVLTTALLFEYYLISKDLRYLNTVIRMKSAKYFPGQKDIRKSKSNIIEIAIVIHEIVDLNVKQCQYA